MFPLRYWAARFFASRYWPKFGAEQTDTVGQVVRLRATPTEIAVTATSGGPSIAAKSGGPMIVATWGFEEP